MKRCAQILQAHGFGASVLEMYGKPTIRIDPGSIWLNMPMFFAARKRPDFDAHLLERIGQVATAKAKRKKKS